MNKCRINILGGKPLLEDGISKRLEKIISDAGEDIIDWGHFNKWQEFKEEWPREDKAYWEKILKRVSIDREGNRTLNPPLSCEEKAWISDLLNRVIDYGIF